MGPGTSIRRTWKTALLIAVGAAGGGAAFAVASVPGSDGEIHACVVTDDSGAPVTTGANIRIIDPSKGQVCDTSSPAGAVPTEINLGWNQQGPTGPVGPRGAPGKAITIAGGNVITIGGTPITVRSPGSQTFVTPPPLTRNSKPVGTLTLFLGNSQLSFPYYSYTLGGGTRGGAARRSTHEIIVVKTLDKASPLLAKFCANGKHIVRGTLTVRKAGKGQQPYLVIKLDTVLISSYQTGGSVSKDEAPTESLSLNFSKIKFEYKPQNA